LGKITSSYLLVRDSESGVYGWPAEVSCPCQVSKAKIRDWEESFKGGERMPWDYNPNAFDQEPRPWTLDLHIPSDGTSEGFV